MLALRMSSIRSIPAISSAETNSPSPSSALSLSLRFPLRPFLRLLKAAYLPCWSFISESRRGMPGGSEEGPSDSRRASLLPFISGACHAPIGPCPAEGAHCAPSSKSPSPSVLSVPPAAFLRRPPSLAGSSVPRASCLPFPVYIGCVSRTHRSLSVPQRASLEWGALNLGVPENL